MPIVAVELLVIGVVVVLVAVLARMAWLIARREDGVSITETQARENAAPLTTAIRALHVASTSDEVIRTSGGRASRSARSRTASGVPHK